MAATFSFSPGSRSYIGLVRILYVLRDSSDSVANFNWDQNWVFQVLDSCVKTEMNFVRQD